MPPRGSNKKPVKRGSVKPTRTTTRSRGKSSRQSRRQPKIDFKLLEENKAEAEEEKPKEESWLDKLPPVIKPDEPLHQQLLKERRDRRYQKVHQYCSLELDAIFDFAFQFDSINKLKDQDKDEESIKLIDRRIRQLRADFRDGLLTPEPKKQEIIKHRQMCSQQIRPLFSLEVQNYLRITSDSMLADLSNFFDCELNDEVLHDHDSKFDQFLTDLQTTMKPYQIPYHPFDKLDLQFIFCIIGPPGSGKTTICQLFQKVLNANIIEVIPQTQSETAAKKKKATTVEIQPETDPAFEYPLQDAYLIKATDDKTTCQTIAQYLRDNSNRGTIISGFPNTKTQLTMLEKYINQAFPQSSRLDQSPSVQSFQSDMMRPTSPKGSKGSQVLNISGLIFTLNQNNLNEKTIDPTTGNVYSKDFLMPSFLDLYGVVPVDFYEKREEIINRLIKVNLPEQQPFTSKMISALNSFESGCRKNYLTTVIPKCENISKLANILDTFLDMLYRRYERVFHIENPLSTLLNPEHLVKCGLCYHAIQSWRACLNEFGPSIADQSNLVKILGNRLDQMMIDSFDRFALLTCESDTRQLLSDQFASSQMPNEIRPTNNETPNVNFLKTSRESPMTHHKTIPMSSKGAPLSSRPISPTKEEADDNSGITPILSKENVSNEEIKLHFNTNTFEHISKKHNLGSLNLSPVKPSRPPISSPINLDSVEPVRPMTSVSPKLTQNKTKKSVSKIKRPQTSIVRHKLANLTKEDSKDEEKEKTIKRNKEFSDFFKIIWDMSLESRNKALTHVDEIVDKSGLNELVSELRKATKLIFLALIRRLFYTRWFYRTFYDLSDDRKAHPSDFLEKYRIDTIEPPQFNPSEKAPIDNPTNMSHTVLPTYQMNNNPLSASKSAHVFQNKDDLIESKNNEELKENEEITFSMENTTKIFDLPLFHTDIEFDAAAKYGDKFFEHILNNMYDKKLVENVKSSHNLFKNFSIAVSKKEVLLRESISNLRHSITEYAHTKCSHEMEWFTENFRRLRNEGTLDCRLFEYDLSMFSQQNLKLAHFSMKQKQPVIAQNIVSFSSILRIAQILRTRNQKYTSLSTFLAVMRSASIDQREMTAIEFCVKIFVCSECFSIRKLLLCFIQFPEQADTIESMLPE